MPTTPLLTPESIKQWRDSRKLTQQQLADLLNVGVASVARWEGGTAEPTGPAKAILEALMTAGDPEKQATREEMIARFGKTAGIAGILGVAGLPLGGIGLASYGIYKLLKEAWEPNQAQKVCPACETPTASNARFCGACGLKLTQ